MPDPLEFGIVIADEDGRIQRFLEKPTWGQVFSDTVNTGVYIMEPEVLAEVSAKESVDWSHDVFPKLLARGAPIFGYISDRYWEDVGTLESYLKAQADVLARRVEVDIAGFEVSPGVWLAEGAVVDPDAVLTGPVVVGEYAKIEAGAHLREYSVIGANVVVKEGAFIHRAVVHNNVFVGQGTTLRGCVVGKNTDVMRRARIEEAAVVGDECVVEPEAYISAGVKVYPFKTIEAGAVVNTSVVWESRGQRTLFGQRGVSGLINVEVTPELCVRLASAYATMLKKGSTVTTSRDVSRAARTLKRAVQSALNASRHQRHGPGGAAAAGGPVRDRSGLTTAAASRCAPRRGTRSRSTSSSWTSTVRSCPRPRSGGWSGCSPGRSSGAPSPARSPSCPTRRASWTGTPTSCCARVDLDGVRDAGLKVVADCAGGTVSLVLPSLLGRIGVEVLTLNNRLDEVTPTADRRAAASRHAAARRGRLVLPGRVRGAVRPGRRADPARRREGHPGQRRACAARRARPGRGGDARRAGWRCRSPRRGWPSRSAGSTACRSAGPRRRWTR